MWVLGPAKVVNIGGAGQLRGVDNFLGVMIITNNQKENIWDWPKGSTQGDPVVDVTLIHVTLKS